MSAQPAPRPSFHDLSAAELHTVADPSVAWLWDGYLAAGNVTLLTSPWKAGKTTLLAVLLARLAAGGTLAGRTVQPGRAIVISEESATLWAGRCAKLNIGDDWQALIDHMLALRQVAGLELVVIDPLAAFLPCRNTSEAAVILAALLPIQQLTAVGVSVLLLHHPRKQASPAGQWARGSGALTGFADILLEMHYVSTADADDRRRKLLAYSRHEATPRRLVIELDAAGAEWLALGDVPEEEYNRGWKVLRSVLADAEDRLLRPEILAAWPAHEPAPCAMTLYRWLETAVAAGDVLRQGTGRTNDPFRYWLKGQEAKWQAADPFWELNERTEDVLKNMRKKLSGG